MSTTSKRTTPMSTTAEPLLSPTAITVVHKYIRQELFAVSHVLSQAAPKDLPKVQQALQEVTVLLYHHAEHEDAHLAGPLAEVAPKLAKRMGDDHHRLDSQLDDVLTVADELDGLGGQLQAGHLLQLHLDWNRFVSAYLAHLDDEERVLFPAIKDHLPAVTVVAQAAMCLEAEQQQAFLAKLEAALTAEEFRLIQDEVTALAPRHQRTA